MRDAFRDIRVRLARMNAFLQEHISGMKVVQAFAQEAEVARDFDVINVEYRKANSRAIAADAALYSIVEAVGLDRDRGPAVARRQPDRRAAR